MKPRQAFFCFLIGIGFTVLASPAALATTRRVTNLNDSNAGSLRDVIAQSINGDRIEFDVTGTISLISGELTIARSITIVGPGAGNLTVKRFTGTQGFRILHVLPNGATTPSVSISGLTISGGSDFGGGGLLNESSQVTLSNCVIVGNTDLGSNGGGILSSGT